MRYVLDSTVLMGIARGDRMLIERLSWYRKNHVGVPHPVLIDVHALVEALQSRGASKRWALLRPELIRIPWTDAVTARLLALGRNDLDAIVAAHALADDLHIVTTQPGRYAWADGVRVEQL